MDDIMLLFLAGLLAGSMNALAGGGSFVSLPALISVGVPSVAANATSTLALFPGGMASSWVYRDGVRSVCGVNVMPIAIVTVMGGVAGSILLLLTPSRIFDGILPWLLLVATLMLAAGPRLSAVFRTQARPSVLTFARICWARGAIPGCWITQLAPAMRRVLEGVGIGELVSPVSCLTVKSGLSIESERPCPEEPLGYHPAISQEIDTHCVCVCGIWP
nr:sulfite exporter TauE/SafE family protein [Rhizobium laguerreae]